VFGKYERQISVEKADREVSFEAVCREFCFFRVQINLNDLWWAFTHEVELFYSWILS
jgi:hypothetical protein